MPNMANVTAKIEPKLAKLVDLLAFGNWHKILLWRIKQRFLATKLKLHNRILYPQIAASLFNLS